MCPRDWSTSLCTQCETLERWEGRYDVRKSRSRVNHPYVVHGEGLNTCTDQPHWCTSLLPVKRKLHARRRQGCWGFVFLLQNKTTIHNREMHCFYICMICLYRSFPLRVIFQIFLTPEPDRCHTEIYKKTFLLFSSFRLMLISLACLFLWQSYMWLTLFLFFFGFGPGSCITHNHRMVVNLTAL